MPHDLWQNSIAVASICQVIARQLRVPSDKVFLTGLLHGIGQFYIMVRRPTRRRGSATTGCSPTARSSGTPPSDAQCSRRRCATPWASRGTTGGNPSARFAARRPGVPTVAGSSGGHKSRVASLDHWNSSTEHWQCGTRWQIRLPPLQLLGSLCACCCCWWRAAHCR
ncbi:MAG: HDOD domain-containing protein [Steroidobacteraceae bacterium]